eukprot:CAMPEP_0179076014 /NCGR_PEP_ID=MMETSP0796-20121207/33883_1 /TAXON_ID=73915 /ORGANISM="Pyrodinium bahamense, Strain pbaha01" /LENGTH=355 /DNA_ID=CAMNT_0020773255 /DNA_START=57 /DNA_END=1124 /DNA_ORIENTATION=-
MGCCWTRDSKDIEVQSVWYKDFEKALPAMKGKRVAITGTTSGTGLVAACACAKKGAEVILLNRPSARAEVAERQVKAANPEASVHSIPCDLMNFSSVRAAKKAFSSKFAHGGTPFLDVLCCNAGVMAFPDRATGDGFDIQMQTNHLSHFLLVKEFFPELKAAAKANGEARIVNHSSGARHGDPLDAKYFGKNGGSLGGDGRKACFERYHHTKLANVAFTYALDAKLRAAGLGIKAVCVTPGIAATALLSNLEASGTDLGAMGCLIQCIGPCLVQSAEDGAMPLLVAMVSPDVASGDLITPSKGLLGRNPPEAWGPPVAFKRPLPYQDKSWVCEEERAQVVVWEESEAAIGEKFTI